MERIKAIETVYNGYRFRSRLEARWAVFFDAAGIQYQYEPEGFQVQDTPHGNIRYLPDFYLPDFDCYAEVKPSKSLLMKESGKLGEIIDFESTPVSKGLLVLGEIPYYDARLRIIPAFIFYYWHKGVCISHAQIILPGCFAHMPRKPVLYKFGDGGGCTGELPEDPTMPERLWDRYGGPTIFDKNSLPFVLAASSTSRASEMLLKCFTKARQARFEHGETP